jgi:hypothetical protein
VSREKFQSARTDIPTTSWEAAVFVNKVICYVQQVSDREHNHHCFFGVLHPAHEEINRTFTSEPYVSTYVDKSIPVPASQVHAGEVQEREKWQYGPERQYP